MMHCKKPVFILKQMLTIKRGVITSARPATPLLGIEDMPKPKSLPLIGTRFDVFAAGGGTKLHEYIDYRHKQLGPIFCEQLGGSTDLVFVSDPDLIRTLFMNLDGKYPAHILPDPWVFYEKLYGSKRGLFFMNGSEWLENRKIMNTYLLKEGSHTSFDVPIKTTVEKLIQEWKSKAEEGSFVPNLESEFYRLSIDVIIAVMLGDTLPKSHPHCNALLNMFSDSVKKIFRTTTKLYGLPVNWCEKLNLKIWTDFKESVDMSLLLAHKIVDEMLIYKEDSNGLINKLAKEKIMTNENIKKIVADLIIAAGDTTAYTSLWTLLLISKNQTGKYDCMKNIVKESMRLYPVAPFLTRILPKDSVLGQYILQQGTPVIASIYTSGRDEQNFSRATEFLPYRWDRNDPRKKDLANHISSASLPFAMGARSCIGKKLAVLQMSELMTQIVENFDLKCVNKDEVTAVTSQVLVPSKDVHIEFTLRNRDSVMKL